MKECIILLAIFWSKIIKKIRHFFIDFLTFYAEFMIIKGRHSELNNCWNLCYWKNFCCFTCSPNYMTVQCLKSEIWLFENRQILKNLEGSTGILAKSDKLFWKFDIKFIFWFQQFIWDDFTLHVITHKRLFNI